MESQFEKLKSLFISNPYSAIIESQKIICSVSNFSNYEDFYLYHQQNSHISTCQREWSSPQMSIHCFDCGIDPQSCICLQCFLNGNHQNHDYSIFPDSTGNCDCGDLDLWKKSGFCHEHQGLNENDHPEYYLDEKLRNTLTDVIFKAAFSSLSQLRTQNDKKVSQIFQFISSFLKFGDGFRRLIAISLTEKIDFENLIGQVFSSSFVFNQLLQQLCGNLTNDQLFKVNFGCVNFKLLVSKTIPELIKALIIHSDVENYSMWNEFWFQSFTFQTMKAIIEKFNWDWVNFVLQFSSQMKEFFNMRLTLSEDDEIPSVFTELSNNIYHLTKVEPNEPTQKLFDELFQTVLNCGTDKTKENNTIVCASFNEIHQENYYYSIHLFSMFFYQIIQSFKMKKNLKLDKLIEELDKTIDISSIFCINHNVNGDENDLFVANYVDKVDDISSLNSNKVDSEIKVPIELHFKSFHNGGAFLYAFPLYDSLCHLFKLDNLNRVKIAKLLSLAKFKKLRIQLGIVTLKKLVAYICCELSLVCKKNFSIMSYILPLTSTPSFFHIGIPLIFPLFQLLIGLESEKDGNYLDEFSIKEFFAFEMARELGIFDDFTSDEYKYESVDEKQKLMTLSFLYYSILLVIERTIFNFNGYYFLEEQIIYALKQKNTSLYQLAEMYSSESARLGRDQQDFNQILLKVSTNQKNKNGEGFDNRDTCFILKEGIEWKTLSAINPFIGQTALLNDQISKNPSELIKIPEFEDEETYFFHPSKEIKANPEYEEDDEIDSNGLNIRLKEFLLTPTVLAVVYHALRTNNEKNELNDHLAMNVLILISKFIKNSNDNDSSFDNSTSIQYNSTIVDLISQFKKVLFNFKIDEKGNATIRNTLNNRSNFNAFLNMKIGSENHEPKSFIDLLINKGELGRNVLSQLKVDVQINDDKNELNSMISINKQRANKLKENILNHFKTIITNYNTNELDANEDSQSLSPNENQNNEDVCSICSTSNSKGKILSYPLYIYRTKLPFIFDKPPFVSIIEGSELAADEDKELPTDFLLKDQHNYDDFNEEEEEEEEEDALDNEDEDDTNLLSRVQQMKEEIKSTNAVQNTDGNSSTNNHCNENANCDVDKSKSENLNVKTVLKRCTVGNNFVIQFSICQHPIHLSCVKSKFFYCPIDRSLKNGFLPCIDILKPSEICNSEAVNDETISISIQDAIFCFINNFTSLFDKQNNKQANLFAELVKSISGLISTYEVRLRSLPYCLDSKKSKILTRNLFLTVWYGYRLLGKPLIENSETDERLTTFQRFILKLIECDEIEGINDKNRKEKINQIITSFLRNSEGKNFFTTDDERRREKEIFLFLRRVCLSNHFLLNNDDESQAKFIDWDEILSVSNLSQKFNTPLEKLKGTENDFEFSPIVFTKLPKEFLKFALNPFNFPVERTFDFTFYNILDYNRLIQTYDDFNDDVKSIEKFDENDSDHLKNEVQSFRQKNVNPLLFSRFEKKDYPSVLLLIGKFASDVVVNYGKNIVSLKPFYLDKFGCADVDYKRNQPLFLNEERYERLMDEILSGDFTNSLIFIK